MLNLEVYQLIAKISGDKNTKGIDDIVSRNCPKRGEEPTVSEKLDYISNLFPGIQIGPAKGENKVAESKEIYNKYLYYLANFKIDVPK